LSSRPSQTHSIYYSHDVISKDSKSHKTRCKIVIHNNLKLYFNLHDLNWRQNDGGSWTNCYNEEFWYIKQCSPLKVNRRFGGTCHIHLQGRSISHVRNQVESGSKRSSCSKLVSWLAYSFTLKMEETCSSETSVELQRTTWRYNIEDRTHDHRCENLDSYINCTIISQTKSDFNPFANACWIYVHCKWGTLALFWFWLVSDDITRYMKSKQKYNLVTGLLEYVYVT
jgi:hypothetical protein